ncbi:hypothetical protein Taro_006484 [Colocasia esculenta]|uniref:Ubiquitin-like protease family profile domain-containing protein n=1 Tax=Colocasia esculenta TaxID=4460 RepID=A0A843U0X2_COLES|nr:hypothetical protein [Colocasia esculenta]
MFVCTVNKYMHDLLLLLNEEEEERKRKKKEKEEAERKKKEKEEAERKREEEKEAKRKKKEEEEEQEKKRKRRQISPSSLSRRVSAGTRIRRQPECYTYMSTIFTVSSITDDSLNSCQTCFLTCREFMFNGSEEGLDNFLLFHDIWELLFARESESVVIDCYVNAYLFRPREENPDIFWNFGYLGAVLKGYVQSCRDNKSKKEHFEYAFRTLDRAPNEFDLIFSPMHVGMNHWALLVIHIKEKEFHVYDSLRSKHRADIPQYVEELKRYLKGKHIDADKWPLRYHPCPQL